MGGQPVPGLPPGVHGDPVSDRAKLRFRIVAGADARPSLPRPQVRLLDSILGLAQVAGCTENRETARRPPAPTSRRPPPSGNSASHSARYQRRAWDAGAAVTSESEPRDDRRHGISALTASSEARKATACAMSSSRAARTACVPRGLRARTRALFTPAGSSPRMRAASGSRNTRPDSNLPLTGTLSLSASITANSMS
jgi:hypothetical protein